MKEEYVAIKNELDEVYERLKNFPDVTLIIMATFPCEDPEDQNCLLSAYGSAMEIAYLVHNLIKSNPAIVPMLTKIAASEAMNEMLGTANSPERPI